MIYDDRQVGIYHSMVVGADDAAALSDSLTRWGFLHAQNRERALEALQHYIDRSWYFAVFRVDPRQVPGGEEAWSGGLDPVRLTFASAEPIYPLRISALSAASGTELLLYVCADHRMTFPGASTEYVNRLTAGEAEAIRRRYAHLGPLLAEGRWVTKLRRVFSPDEMTEDLELVPAASDEEFRPIYFGGVPAAEALLLLGLLLGAGIARHHRRLPTPGR